jgi:opacity protein-like surface antigen
MRYVLMCAAVLAVLVPGLARAAADGAGEEKASSAKTDHAFYGGIGGIASLDAYNLPNFAQGEAGWGMDVRAGYRFSPHLGAELQYQFIPHTQLNYVGDGTDSFASNALTANGKLFIFDGPVQPYALFGLGFVHMSGTRFHGTNLEAAIRGGGGVQVLFTEHFGLYGEITYLHPFTTLSDFNTVPIAFGAIAQF